jgi:hypothetical protein
MLPKIMTQQPRWVNWFKPRDSRSKIAIDPKTGKAAFKKDSGPRSNSWSDFVTASKRDPRRLGFDIADPFVAVDLDHVVKKAAG